MEKYPSSITTEFVEILNVIMEFVPEAAVTASVDGMERSATKVCSVENNDI